MLSLVLFVVRLVRFLGAVARLKLLELFVWIPSLLAVNDCGKRWDYLSVYDGFPHFVKECHCFSQTGKVLERYNKVTTD